jgi:hypothetical protein
VIPFFRYVVTIFSTEAASVRFRKEVPGSGRERSVGRERGIGGWDMEGGGMES